MCLLPSRFVLRSRICPIYDQPVKNAVATEFRMKALSSNA